MPKRENTESVMIMAGRVKITDLDDGNLKMTTDFRRVYASMIQQWLGYKDSAAILKGNYEPLGLFA